MPSPRTVGELVAELTKMIPARDGYGVRRLYGDDDPIWVALDITPGPDADKNMERVNYWRVNEVWLEEGGVDKREGEENRGWRGYWTKGNVPDAEKDYVVLRMIDGSGGKVEMC